ncbi:hypothetical protein Tco_0800424 [Tanacetum coccineum]|uniref:Uncharacterized protein n=1 Tax=Tanacetum coccineum TaxID=301880 RepID=A0ABQ4ZW05_9ASTR
MVALLPLEVVEDILLGKETSLKEYQSISEENIKGTKTTKETSLKEEEGADRVWRTKEKMDEDKDTDEVGLSTEDEVSTAKKGVSTDFEKVSTDRPKLSTDDLKVSTDEQMEK